MANKSNKKKHFKTDTVAIRNQSLKQRVFSKAQQVYTNSPLNFSLLTGWKYPSIPRLLGNPLIGRLTNALTDEGVMQNLTDAGKLAMNHPSGLCYYWIGTRVVILITRPEHVKEVLFTNNENVSRRSMTRFLEKIWGNSIISDDNELWRKKKTAYVNHLIIPKALNKNEEQLNKIVNKYLQKIQLNGQNEINLRELVRDFSLEMVLSIMMPYDPTRDITKYKNYISCIGENILNFKNIFKWSLPPFVRKIFSDKKTISLEQLKLLMRNNFDDIILCPYKHYIENTDNFLRSIWELRKHEKKNTTLEKSTDVFGDGNALFFAAHENVSTAFESTIKLLGANPDIEKKLHNEIMVHLKNEALSMETVNRIEYLEMVIKESLRLCPPAGFYPRVVDKAFKIDNLPISKGSIILISPYFIHQQPDIWNEPERFDPERFSHENITKIPRHAYIPFGAGMHSCVGSKFALQQLKFLITAIYMQYHVEIENTNFEMTYYHTVLRPKRVTMARFISLH